jgi:tRNA pseudouridine55 synthase
MDGIVCIDKPDGWTSFDVIAKLRGILKERKIGHAGTLDPMATGVLPIFVGKCTKLIPKITNHDKEYIADFQIGLSTNTQDITGIVTKTTDVCVTAEQLLSVFPKFTGDIEQIPPMFSAVKVKGKKLYEYARKGIEIERKVKNVTVFSIKLLQYENNCGKMKVACSSGTYIRTLINDIGEELAAGGTLTALMRTMACGWKLEDCVTLEDVQDGNIKWLNLV